MKKIKKYTCVWSTGIGMVLLLLLPIHAWSQDAPDFEQLKEQALESGIDGEQLEEFSVRADREGMTGDQIAEIVTLAVSLSENNLPSDMIFKKGLEGITKGVPDEQLISVLQDLGETARQASGVVDPWMERPEVKEVFSGDVNNESAGRFRGRMIEATSKAMSQNFQEDILESMLNEIADESLMNAENAGKVIAAVNILPDLPDAAARPEQSKAVVMRAFKGGFGTGEMQRLPGAMNLAQSRSQLPASAVLDGVARQMQDDHPASEILQNLFNGNVTGGPPGNIPTGPDNRPDRGNRGGNSGNN